MSLRQETIKDKTHVDVWAFQDNIETLKGHYCHTQKPTLYLKIRIESESVGKRLWLYRPYFPNLEVWSNIMWKAHTGERLWIGHKASHRDARALSC